MGGRVILSKFGYTRELCYPSREAGHEAIDGQVM